MINCDISCNPVSEEEDRVLSTQQLASLWGVCQQTILDRINEGALPAFAVGHNYRIRLSSVKSFEERFSATGEGKRKPRTRAEKAKAEKRRRAFHAVGMQTNTPSCANN